MCTISVFSRATAALQHQRQDQGARHPPAQNQWPVSTNFFSSVSSLSPSLPPCSLAPRHPSFSLYLRSSLILHLTLCTFPMDHYFLLVTLYDELVQVRCSRREAFTGSPFFVLTRFFVFPPNLPSSHAGRLLFLPLSQLCFPSFLPSKRNTSYDLNEGKCEGKITSRIGNTGRKRLGKRDEFAYTVHILSYLLSGSYILSVPRFKYINFNNINYSDNTHPLCFFT